MHTEEAIGSQLERFQRTEITEYNIYKRLAKIIKSEENQKILERIAEDEFRHYQAWKRYTEKDVAPNMWAVWFYVLVSRLFGFTFGVKLMERGEENAQLNYEALKGKIPNIETWIQEEDAHEQALLGMLDEERLRYAGSVVLGLNDALVELTGALAGLTLALQNTRLIALSGLITGIAASLSMAASEYLSTRSESTQKHPVRAALYTGLAYVITVTLLILPYLIFDNYLLDLGISLVVAVLIIAVFNYYISVAKNEPFRPRFLEMTGLSFGVAAFSFGIGYLIRLWLGIDI